MSYVIDFLVKNREFAAGLMVICVWAFLGYLRRMVDGRIDDAKLSGDKQLDHYIASSDARIQDIKDVNASIAEQHKECEENYRELTGEASALRAELHRAKVDIARIDGKLEGYNKRREDTKHLDQLAREQLEGS